MVDDGAARTGRALAALLRAQDGLDRARAALVAAAGAEWVSAGADAYRESLDLALADVARCSVALGRSRWVVLRHLEAADAAEAEIAREQAAWRAFLFPTTAGAAPPPSSPP